jgi:O-antigen/teichoic acid export membrane protein
VSLPADPPQASLTGAALGGRRALIGSGLVLAVAVALANVLNAALQFALARVVERDEYSLLAALFVIVTLGAVPPLAFQAMTAREVASRIDAGRRAEAGTLLRSALRSIARWTVILLVLTAVVVPVAAVLGLSEPLALAATAATVAFGFVNPVVWGGLQGAGLFRSLSASTVLLSAARLAVGISIAAAGGSVGVVMVGVAAATAVTAAVSVIPLRRLLTATRGARTPPLPLLTASNVGAAVGLTALMALATSDLLVAKLAFPAGRAGDYATASVGARALLLIPVAVTTVLFPRVATLRDRDRERRHLLAGLAAVAVASAAATAFLWGLSSTLIELTFGAKYDDAAPWLGPLSLAMALYTLVTVYLYHFLSLGRARFAAVLVGLLAVQIVLFAALHDSPRELIGVQIGTAATALVASEVWHVWRHR